MVRYLAGNLFAQVVLATVLGLGAGLFFPSLADDVGWMTALFMRLIIMAVGPLLFCIVTLGILGAGSLKTAGRQGGQALLYFESMTTLALGVAVLVAIGLGIGKGVGFVPTAEDARMMAAMRRICERMVSAASCSLSSPIPPQKLSHRGMCFRSSSSRFLPDAA